MPVPLRPPLDGLKRRLDERRNGAVRRDGFVRESFALPRPEARAKAKEWFERWPRQGYWTEVESWRECPGDVIEFTMRRLPTAD